jgi:hypothetical protein
MSNSVTFSRESVNADALIATLRDAFGDDLSGISVSQGENEDSITLYFVDVPTEAQRDQAQELISAHDPSLKSAGQQEQEAIEAQREEFLAAPLDVETFDDDALLRQLAERVAWLERELARLVG